MPSTDKLDGKMADLRSVRGRIETAYLDRVRNNEEAMWQLVEEKKLAVFL